MSARRVTVSPVPASTIQVKRWASTLNAAVYRMTGGRLLGRMGGQPVLLLQTVGRRTGRRRTTPVQYLERVARKAGHELPLLILEPVAGRGEKLGEPVAD